MGVAALQRVIRQPRLAGAAARRVTALSDLLTDRQTRLPNQEVYQSLINGLLKVWTPNGPAMLGNKRRLGAYFASLGLDLTPEDASQHGRLDLTVKFNGHIYLFEFKVVKLEPEGRALPQIKDRGYADQYRAEGQPIHRIGVEFSREQRTVVGFAVETD